MIKAIAVDMDGTFLTSNNTYDQPRFEKIYQQLLAQDIQFIVASGNQYYQLKSFFPDKEDSILYVAENGAIIGTKEGVNSVASFSVTLIQQIVCDLVDNEEELEFVLCGVKSAYLLNNCSQRFKDFAKKYYYRLQEVPSFDSLPEDIFVKVALDVAVEKTEAIVQQLNITFINEILAVSSGHGSIDIIIPGVTKGATVAQLLMNLSIQPNELLAFGDANNDIEMLALTEHSYAMAESSEQVRQVAKHRAPSNNASGVLEVIEEFLRASE